MHEILFLFNSPNHRITGVSNIFKKRKATHPLKSFLASDSARDCHITIHECSSAFPQTKRVSSKSWKQKTCQPRKRWGQGSANFATCPAACCFLFSATVTSNTFCLALRLTLKLWLHREHSGANTLRGWEASQPGRRAEIFSSQPNYTSASLVFQKAIQPHKESR